MLKFGLYCLKGYCETQSIVVTHETKQSDSFGHYCYYNYVLLIIILLTTTNTTYYWSTSIINAPKVQIPRVEMPRTHTVTANYVLELHRLKKRTLDSLHNWYHEKLI